MVLPTDQFTSLLTAARAGARESLGEILETYRAYLCVVAQANLDPALRAKGSPSDLVQETFLEAQRDFAQFKGASEDELLAWLRQLLLNNLANFTRHFRETAKRSIDREVPLAGSSSSDLAASLVIDALSPSGIVLAREQVQLLQQALLRLPEDYRQVLLWRYQEDLPFEAIASRLDRSSTAVRKLWARAVERLQQELEQSQ